jgi:hypothetical protein
MTSKVSRAGLAGLVGSLGLVGLVGLERFVGSVGLAIQTFSTDGRGSIPKDLLSSNASCSLL